MSGRTGDGREHGGERAGERASKRGFYLVLEFHHALRTANCTTRQRPKPRGPHRRRQIRQMRSCVTGESCFHRRYKISLNGERPSRSSEEEDKQRRGVLAYFQD